MTDNTPSPPNGGLNDALERLKKLSADRKPIYSQSPAYAPDPAQQMAAKSQLEKLVSPKRLLTTDSATRKTYPMARGLLDYFPDALAEVSKVSFLGNEKHNPG